MMKRVNPGQPIDIKATEWNAMLDAAQAEIDRKYGSGSFAMQAGLSFGIAMALNATGASVSCGQPVVVSGFSIAPTDTVNSEHVTVLIAAPLEDDERPMAVVLDPCPPNNLTRIRLAGLAIVRPTRRPAADEYYLAFGADGALLPSLFGQARIMAAAPEYALVLLGSVHYGEPPESGMFQLVNATITDGPPTVRICDGNNINAAIAGVATINSQSYSCPAREFILAGTPLYFYFKFTPPAMSAGGEQTASVCDVVALSDADAVVSTDSVFYRLIGYAWTETINDRAIVKLSQAHRPGNLVVNWYGPCIGLLEGIVEP